MVTLTLRGHFKLQHSLFCNYEVLLFACDFQDLPAGSWHFLIPKTKEKLDCLEPKTAPTSCDIKININTFPLGVVGGWDAPIFFIDPTVAYFRMFFFWILYMFFCTQGTCSKIAYIPSMGGQVTTISARPSRCLVLHVMTVMKTLMYIFLRWIVSFQYICGKVDRVPLPGEWGTSKTSERVFWCWNEFPATQVHTTSWTMCSTFANQTHDIFWHAALQTNHIYR